MRAVSTASWLNIALRFALFVLGCWLLSYGSAMILFVPGTPGHHFDANFVIYGIIPLILGGSVFAMVGVLAARSK